MLRKKKPVPAAYSKCCNRAGTEVVWKVGKLDCAYHNWPFQKSMGNSASFTSWI